MAIQYDSLFGLLCKYAYQVWKLDQTRQNIAAAHTALLNFHSTYGALSEVEDLEDTFNSIQDQITAAIYSFKPMITEVLYSNTLLLNALPLGSSPTETEILNELINIMSNGDIGYLSPRVEVNSTDLSPGTGNVADYVAFGTADNGRLLVTNLIDNAVPPKANLPVQKYFGTSLHSGAIIPSETVYLTCTADSQSGGRTEGAELFSIVSNKSGRLYSKEGYGSGTGSPLTVSNSTSLISNGDFESWGGSAPTNFTASTGVKDTDFEQYTSAPYRGSSSLRFLSGSTGAKLTYTVPKTSIIRNRRYLFHFFFNKTAGTDAIILRVKDGSTTLGSTSLTSNSANYQQGILYLLIPPALTNDLTIELEADPSGASLSNAIIVDDLIMSEVSYFGGLGYNLLAGPTSSPFASGDLFTIPVSVDDSSYVYALPRMLAAFYGMELPYVESGGGTFIDLAALTYQSLSQATGYLFLENEDASSYGIISLTAKSGGDASGYAGNSLTGLNIIFGAGSPDCTIVGGVLTVSVTQAEGVADVDDLTAAIDGGDHFAATTILNGSAVLDEDSDASDNFFYYTEGLTGGEGSTES